MAKETEIEEEVIEETETVKVDEVVEEASAIAKKDFRIFIPPHVDITITEGENVFEKVKKTDSFYQNLITEGVI